VVSESWSSLPAKFTESTIVPLVKVKCGYLSDVENYRAIIVSAISHATYLLRPMYFQLRAGVRYLAVRATWCFPIMSRLV